MDCASEGALDALAEEERKKPIALQDEAISMAIELGMKPLLAKRDGRY